MHRVFVIVSLPFIYLLFVSDGDGAMVVIAYMKLSIWRHWFRFSLFLFCFWNVKYYATEFRIKHAVMWHWQFWKADSVSNRDIEITMPEIICGKFAVLHFTQPLVRKNKWHERQKKKLRIDCKNNSKHLTFFANSKLRHSKRTHKYKPILSFAGYFSRSFFAFISRIYSLEICFLFKMSRVVQSHWVHMSKWQFTGFALKLFSISKRQICLILTPNLIHLFGFPALVSSYSLIQNAFQNCLDFNCKNHKHKHIPCTRRETKTK